MDTALFDYDLPEALIAQAPAAQRDQSRLFVYKRDTGERIHTHFHEIGQFLPPSLNIYRNNASVLKARLPARKVTGGKAECLLLKPAVELGQWWCLIKPGKDFPVGGQIVLPDVYEATLLEKQTDGQCRIEMRCLQHDSVVEMARQIGEVPLPPYIKRPDPDTTDEDRYETVYADRNRPVAVAAPTAGLHFTQELVGQLQRTGHRFHDLTLHVGLGTFRPLQTEQVEAHLMHSEFYQIPGPTLQTLDMKEADNRLAIGTTSLRALEDFFRRGGANAAVTDFTAEAELFIYPPDTFHINHLVTNFHLPRSTLMCLVSAYLTPGSEEGIKVLKALYEEAIALKYRFYSYGDAMLIL